MKIGKRKVDTVVISDVHLGTYGCHAMELNKYLKSIEPETIVLNGDIIDIWQFNKRYWPKSHMQVIKQLMGFVAAGTKVVYVTGNHDEMLRKFVGFQMGSLEIVNKVVLKKDGVKTWIFHGDVFDVTMQHSKWLAKLGAVGYDLLILINRFVNFISDKMGRGRISLSKRVKDGVKSAIKFIDDFEKTASSIAIDKEYDYVICGHIHQPVIRSMSNDSGNTTYMNSGDWVENLTALECMNGNWSIYRYHDDLLAKNVNEHVYSGPQTNTELFRGLVKEFELLAS